MTKKTVKKEKKANGKFGIVRAPTHNKYYVTNVRGGLTSQDFRFEIINEKLVNDKKEVCYISDATLILSFVGAKRLFALLSKSIKEYEDEHGTIKEPKEKFLKL